MKNPKTKKLIRVKYSSLLAIDAYRLAASGCTEAEMAKILGITTVRLRKWIKTKKIFKYAMESADKAKGKDGKFVDYVYSRLDPALQELWDEMEEESDPELADKERFLRVRDMIRGKDVRSQQHLFVHALIKSGFSPSSAIAKTGIPKTRIDKWVEEDPKFAELLREVDYHKKNFLEEKLMSLVEGGHAHATIFANRTQNADRGYGDRSTLSIEGNINITHKMVPIETLNLDVDTMRTILQAMKVAEPIDTGAPVKALPMGKVKSDEDESGSEEVDDNDPDGSTVVLPEEESEVEEE
jgi:hypothetical protein